MRIVVIALLGLALLAAETRGQNAGAGWLGVQLQDLTNEEAGALGWGTPRGAKIAKTIIGSPAEKAGLKPNDILVFLDDVQIENSRAFVGMVGKKVPGASVRLGILRAGRAYQLAVILGLRPVEFDTAKPGEDALSAIAAAESEAAETAAKAIKSDWSALPAYRQYVADTERMFDALDDKIYLEDGKQEELKSKIKSDDAKIVAALGELPKEQALDVKLRIALGRARIQYASAAGPMAEISEELTHAREGPFMGRDAEIRTAAARIYLAQGLPWTAGNFLPSTLPQSAAADTIQLANRIAWLLNSFDEDSPEVACRLGDQFCRKLRHLLAVPPIAHSGDYLAITQKDRPHEIWGKPINASTEWMQPARANRRPLLNFIANAQPPSAPYDRRVLSKPLNQKVASPRLRAVMMALADSPQSQQLAEQLLSKLSGDPSFTKLLPKSGSAAARNQSADNAEGELKSAQVVEAGRMDGSVFAIIRTCCSEGPGYIVLRMGSGENAPLDYWYSEAGNRVRHAINRLDEARLPWLIISRAIGSNHSLSLWILDLSNGRVLYIVPPGDEHNVDVPGFDHGAFQFVDFDVDGLPELQITYLDGDRRYSDCNQCPSRRVSEIWKISPRLDQAQKIGTQVSWADLSVATDSGLFGLDTQFEFAESTAALNKALAEFPALRKPISELRDQAWHMNDLIAGLTQARDYDGAAKALQAIARVLAQHPNAADLEDLRGVALFNSIAATMEAGRVKEAESLLAEIDRSGIKFQQETRDRMELVRFDIAREHGDLKELFQILQKLERLPILQNQIAYRQITYLLEIGDNAGAIEAAKLGSTDEELSDDIALQRGVALYNLGRYDESLDELLVLARSATSSRVGKTLVKVYLLGARIAFNTKNFETGRYLLDAAVSHMPADFWKTESPLILSLYATYYHGVNQNPVSRRFLEKGITAAQIMGGVRLAVPYDLLAQIEEESNERAAAAKASLSSIGALLGEQEKVVSEPHKLTFVESADRIAEAQVVRLIRIGSGANAIFAALESWRSQVLRSTVRGAQTQEPRPLDPVAIVRQVQSRLGEGEVLVSYWTGAGGSLALVVDKTGVRQTSLPTPGNRLQAMRQRVLNQLNPKIPQSLADIQADRLPAGLADDLEQLYRDLIAPLALDPDVTGLVVVPDENLLWVPWAAISSPAKAGDDNEANTAPGNDRRIHSLLKDYLVRVLPSALLIAEPKAPQITSAVLAGSTLGVSSEALVKLMPSMASVLAGTTMRPLPAVRDEIKTITGLLKNHGVKIGQVLLIVADQAANRLPQFIHEKLDTASIVHLAGHGLFDSTDPLASSMLLGGGNAKGAVRAADFAGLDMRAAEIVALSGCETGLAVIRPGQEALGFVRTILAAGARRVLLTQWIVDDVATEKWFAEFYRQLLEGQTPGQAYREATLYIASRYRHPHFWAPITFYAR